MSLPAAMGLPRPRAAVLARIAWLALPAIATLALAAQDGGARTGDWMPWALVAVLAAGGLLAFDVMRLHRGLGLAALGCIAGLAAWSVVSVLWAWLPGDAASEASRALFYASAFAIVLLAVRTQRDAAVMVGLIAAATGLVTLYGCLRLAQGAPDSWMIYQRVGWPTGYPNTSASLGVLGFWTLVGIGAERLLAWPARSLALAAAVPALGFALLTQSRGAMLTLLVVSPFAIALVRERLRVTAFTLVALAGLLPAIPALRTAIDTGSEADAGTAAARLLLGGVLVAAVGGAIAAADQRVSISPERRRMLGRGAAVITALAVVVLAGVALQQDAPGRIGSAFHSFTKVDASGDAGPHLLSVESNRWDFWKVAASDLRARPLTGYGAGSFGPTYLRRGHSSEMPAQAHGQVQELAATLGLPGLLARQRRRGDRPGGAPAPPRAAVGDARRRSRGHGLRARPRTGRLALAGARRRSTSDRTRRLRGRAAPGRRGRSTARRPHRGRHRARARRALGAAGAGGGAPDRARGRRRRSRRRPGGSDDLPVRPGAAAPRRAARGLHTGSARRARGGRPRTAGVELVGGRRPARRHRPRPGRTRLRACPRRKPPTRIVPLR